MSKSKGNVINPDSVVEAYGADTLRVYEMFMGPLEADKPWDTRAVAGVARFLRKFYRLSQSEIEQVAALDLPVEGQARQELVQKLHQTIKKLSEDIPKLKFNTAIASLMELGNLWEKNSKSSQLHLLQAEELLAIWQILAPLAPFMTEELYDQAKYAWQNVKDQTLGEIKCEAAQAQARRQALESIDFAKTIHLSIWPEYDADLVKTETVTLAIQVNGKLRAQLEVEQDLLTNKDEILAQVRALPEMAKWLEGQKIIKEIYVPGKIVSLVVA